MKFKDYYMDLSDSDMMELTKSDRNRLDREVKDKEALMKSSIKTMLLSVDSAILEELEKIEVARKKLVKGNGNGLWQIVAARQKIRDLENSKPEIERELKELF